MALSWVLHSACNVLGYPTGSAIHQETPKSIADYIDTKKTAASAMTVGKDHDSSCHVDQMGSFRMPLRYPRYTKADYEKMEEWKVDMLLQQYGITLSGSLDEKREFAMGTFLWPDQY